MPTLTLRADDLIMAFEDSDWAMRHFFDRQTGEVLILFEAGLGDSEEVAEQIEAEPDRYVWIEPVPSSVGYEVMSDFVESLPESKVRRDLAHTLEQRKPFRRFKDALLNHPSIREDWFRFHEQAFIKIIEEWLDDHNIEATVVPFNTQR